MVSQNIRLTASREVEGFFWLPKTPSSAFSACKSVFFIILLLLVAGHSEDVLAKDLLVRAVSPGYNVVKGPGDDYDERHDLSISTGRDVTFKWVRKKKRDKRVTKIELTTNAGTRLLDENQGHDFTGDQFTWKNYPYGPGWWKVEVWRKSALKRTFWVGITSKQNFLHYNNVPGPDILNSSPYSPASDDPPEFRYKDGPRGGGLDTTLYFEVTKDYTLDLKQFFTDIDKLPPSLIKWQRNQTNKTALINHIKNFPDVKWDFIELADGVLTIKKGYRWDGASLPENDFNLADNEEFYIRPSCVHDAIYDLMRMGYLLHDKTSNVFGEEGYMNRLVADILLYMFLIEDGRDESSRLGSAFGDFEVVRLGGAPKTEEDGKNLAGVRLLAPWKYHIGELTAWTSNRRVYLHWQPADLSLKDPNHYGISHLFENRLYNIFRSRAGSSSWERVGFELYPRNHLSSFYHDNKIFFVDSAVQNGEIYYYQVRNAANETPVTWHKRHHDETSVEAAVPISGPGNALQLNGSRQFVEANTVSQNLGVFTPALTLEAWVYPQAVSGVDTVISFSTPGGSDTPAELSYNGASGQFCFSERARMYHCSLAGYDAGSWYHVAVTIDETNALKLWVNGDLSQAEDHFTETRPEKRSLFSIGQIWHNRTAAQHFAGKLDEIRVWNVARTQQDIRADICSSMRGDQSGLVALFHFDEPQGTPKAHDATRNDHEGGLARFLPNESPFVPSTAMLPSFSSIRPVAAAGSDQIVIEGSPVSLDGSASYHPCGDIWYFDWDYGDGSFADSGAQVSHHYDDDGTYAAMLTVTDGSGLADTDSLAVEVLNVSPDVDAGIDQTVTAGETVFLAGSFFDPGSNDTHTIAWDFGDGTQVVNGTLTPNHVYTGDGLYTVMLTVSDDDGGIGVDHMSVTVVPLPGDLNRDGIVDRADVMIVISLRNQPAVSNLEADIDGDGTITVLDARSLVLMCTYSRCASN